MKAHLGELVGIALLSAACSSTEPSSGVPRSGIDAGFADSRVEAAPSGDGAGASLRPLPPPVDPGPGGFLVTASGEQLALGGYPFVAGASRAADPAFVDGWDVRFDAVLVTLDHVVLAESPDTSPTDQSQTGAQVAHLDGPFAVDLHKGGPLVGKGGEGERAVAIGAVGAMNDRGNAAFDPQMRYAFGYDIVAASSLAFNVNLDEAGLRDYQDAISQGLTALVVGSAAYKGPPATGLFADLPKTVRFRIAFRAPVTYVNCQNPDNDPAEPFPNEEHLRGVQVRPNASTAVQLTVHTDHLFWDKLAHDQALHFDPFACAVLGATEPTVRLEDLAALDWLGFRCKDGRALPPRSVVPDHTPVAGSILYYDSNGVAPLPSFAEFVTYSWSTAGHLNSDGLCAVRRHYASPP
jgi:hypothetical protein